MKIEINHEKYLQEVIKEIIRSRFQDRYTFMIHISTFAALDVSRDLLKASNQSCNFEEEMKIIVKPEYYKNAWKEYFKKPYNFFKHGDHKSSGFKQESIQLNPEYNDVLIYYLIKNLKTLFESNYKCREIEVYKLWFVTTHPELIDRKLFDTTYQGNIDGLINFIQTCTEKQRAMFGKVMLDICDKYNISDMKLFPSNLDIKEIMNFI